MHVQLTLTARVIFGAKLAVLNDLDFLGGIVRIWNLLEGQGQLRNLQISVFFTSAENEVQAVVVKHRIEKG